MDVQLKNTKKCLLLQLLTFHFSGVLNWIFNSRIVPRIKTSEIRRINRRSKTHINDIYIKRERHRPSHFHIQRIIYLYSFLSYQSCQLLKMKIKIRYF